MDLDPEVALQMGFTSFGARPKAKKRKYDSAADTTTDQPPTLASSGCGRGGGTRGGSGSNVTPLGSTRSKQGMLGDAVEEDNRAGSSVVAGPGAAQSDKSVSEDRGAQGRDDEYEEPGYVDDTPPESPLPSLEGEHTQLAEVHEHRPHVLHPPESEVNMTGRPMAEGEGARALVERGKGLASDVPGQRYDWAALRRGVRNQQGDIAYYDRSFMEDPWEGLIGVRGNR
ncbi:MAG: hypothetical protein Q9187_000829 [Circinaria calcarea]